MARTPADDLPSWPFACLPWFLRPERAAKLFQVSEGTFLEILKRVGGAEPIHFGPRIVLYDVRDLAVVRDRLKEAAAVGDEHRAAWHKDLGLTDDDRDGT